MKMKIRDLIKRIRCVFVSCGSQVALENSQVDGIDDDNSFDNICV